MSKLTEDMPGIAPNPGGALRPDQVVGRDQLIDDLWRALHMQSVALLAPRRVGKTSIMTRMEAAPAPGFEVVRRNLEGLESTAEFVHVLFDDVERLLKFQLQGPGWKRLLERLFEDLDEALAKRERTLVLMWDEVTLFIGDLIRRGQADDAMALLDSLRAARQRHGQTLRMLSTGSIGFEEILRQLRREHGYRNRPLNDVARRFVPLLDTSGAERLARGLLRHGGKEREPGLVSAMLARGDGGSTRAALIAGLSEFDREAVLAAIRQLEDDFYLRREGERLVFQLDLLRRFWRAERGL